MHADLAFWTRWLAAGPSEDRALARLVANVPAPRRFYEPDELRLAFPQVLKDPALPGGPVWGFVFERIAPLSEDYRRHLILRFVEPRLQEEALKHPLNQYGLLMLYLGAEKGRPARDPRMGNRAFGLREMVMEIGIEGAVELAETMAVTLAVLHWSAHLDGQKVKFMAGAQPSRHHRTIYLSHVHRLHPFSPDPETVRSVLVSNFLANKSWPRPVVLSGEGDTHEEGKKLEGNDDDETDAEEMRSNKREVWTAFRKLYLDVALYVLYRDKDILGAEYAKRWRLPVLFIRHLEASAARKTKAPFKPNTPTTPSTPVDLDFPLEPYMRTEYDDYRERGPRPGEGEGSRMGPSRVWGGRVRAGGGRGENTQFVVKKERDLVNIEEEGGEERGKVVEDERQEEEEDIYD